MIGPKRTEPHTTTPTNEKTKPAATLANAKKVKEAMIRTAMAATVVSHLTQAR
jgi:hypothetical protein